LEPGIDVDVVLLIVVLKKGGEEKFICESDIYARSNQPKGMIIPRCRK